VKSVLVVGSPSAVLVAQRLIESGFGVVAVVPAGPAAVTAAALTPAVAVLVTDRLEVGPDEQLISVFAEPVEFAEWLEPPESPGSPEPVREQVPVLTVRAEHPGLPADPIARAILNRAGCPVRLERPGRPAHRIEVPTAGATAAQVAVHLADACGPLLQPAQRGSAARSTPVQFRLPTAESLPWPASWDEIDWTQDARTVAALIRATALPGRGAWTWWGPIRLGVGGVAEADRAPDPGVPAGTVLAPAGVATGAGAVRLTALTDGIGPLDPGQVTAGERLGLHPAQELVVVRHRLAELENAVALLVERAGLLVPAVPSAPLTTVQNDTAGCPT
jgi:hypothetical protein